MSERPEKPERVYVVSMSVDYCDSIKVYKFEDGRAATEEQYVASLREYLAWLDGLGDEADGEER